MSSSASSAKRLRRNSSELERAAEAAGFRRIAGVDEAGRGPLAGPVVAAACILPPDVQIDGLVDSKRLSPARRSQVFEKLQSDPTVQFSISIVSAEVIDQINILQATLQGMREAISKLHPDYLLVDGRDHPDPVIPGEALVKGDDRSVSIAAASILAKETRDRLMVDLDRLYPGYGFAQHKGYPTAAHRQAIEEQGLCPIHRRSFRAH